MDPTSIRYLNPDEKENSEKLIILSFPKNIHNKTQQSVVQSSKEKRTNQIDDFASSCGFAVEGETLSNNKGFTLKTRIGVLSYIKIIH